MVRFDIQHCFWRQHVFYHGFPQGLKIEIDGTPFEIIEFQHFKPGKGGAMVRTKLRNILNGRVLDNTFRSGEKVERPNLESRDMQFLYHEANSSCSWT